MNRIYIKLHFCLLKQAFIFYIPLFLFSLPGSLLSHSSLVFRCLQVRLLKPFLSVGPWTANCLSIFFNNLTKLLLDIVDLLGVGLNGFLVFFNHDRRSFAPFLVLLLLRRGDGLCSLQIYQPLQHLGLVLKS